MFAVFVNEGNQKQFLAGIPDKFVKDADIIIGAVEEERDVACGVLTARISRNRVIEITFIYVDEQYRNRGAGKAMVEFLQGSAEGMELFWIRCEQVRFFDNPVNEELDAVSGLLYACGFGEREKGNIYECRVRDLKWSKKNDPYPVRKLRQFGKSGFRRLFEDLYKGRDPQYIASRADYVQREYDGEYSIILCGEDDRWEAGVLVRIIENRPLIAEIIRAKDAGDDVVYMMMDMLMKQFFEDFPMETKVGFLVVQEGMYELAMTFSKEKAKKTGEIYEQSYEVPI